MPSDLRLVLEAYEHIRVANCKRNTWFDMPQSVDLSAVATKMDTQDLLVRFQPLSYNLNIINLKMVVR